MIAEEAAENMTEKYQLKLENKTKEENLYYNM